MKQLLQSNKSGEMHIDEVPIPALRAGGLLVRTCCSLISAGTEKMKVDMARSSLLGKARQRPDLVRQVICKAKTEGLAQTLADLHDHVAGHLVTRLLPERVLFLRRKDEVFFLFRI